MNQAKPHLHCTASVDGEQPGEVFIAEERISVALNVGLRETCQLKTNWFLNLGVFHSDNQHRYCHAEA